MLGNLPLQFSMLVSARAGNRVRIGVTHGQNRVSQNKRLVLSGTGFLNSCLPKAETGVSQPGLGLESAYSRGPRIELELRYFRSLPRAVLHPGSGGSQGGLSREVQVGGCSAEGGTRG